MFFSFLGKLTHKGGRLSMIRYYRHPRDVVGTDPALLAHYKERAKERGSFFSREQTVKAVEEMLDSL